MNVITFAYLLILSYLFYGIIKYIKIYLKKRDGKYLFILCILIIIASDFWMRAYAVRLAELFSKFNLILTFIPLLIFLAYDHFEKKRLKEKQEKDKIRNYFSKYLSPKVIDTLIKQKKIKLEGISREISIMFIDICGFTSMSENLKPEEVVKKLNKYFEVSTKILLKRGATIDKFIGDCVMVMFNAPVIQKNHADRAVLSAIEIISELKKLEKILKIEVSIGINIGEAVIGNIGSSKMMDYTSIGDTVNTASRLQGYAGRSEIVISENCLLKLSDTAKKGLSISEPEFIQVKGKKEKIKVYKIK